MEKEKTKKEIIIASLSAEEKKEIEKLQKAADYYEKLFGVK